MTGLSLVMLMLAPLVPFRKSSYGQFLAAMAVLWRPAPTLSRARSRGFMRTLSARRRGWRPTADATDQSATAAARRCVRARVPLSSASRPRR